MKRLRTSAISPFLACSGPKCFQDMLKGDPAITAKLLMHFLKTTAARLRATDKRLELY